MDLKLRGKTAVITGGARGIGKAIVLTFASEGANLVIGDIDLHEAQLVADMARAADVRALAIRADVTRPKEVKKMVGETMDQFGRLDILINNAGIVYVNGEPTTRRLFQDLKEDEDYSPELNIILHGTIICTRAALPSMLKAKSGSIVNIVSEAGLTAGLPGSTMYSAGKGGVVAFSRTLANELAPSGIRVNCVAPGLTKTTRMERLESSADKDAKTAAYAKLTYDQVVARTPLGRMGTPWEIANAAVFLASDASSFTTGQTLVVSGGSFMY
ncbi:MAG: SDR family oxidoreductase [Deltaproteobacteria bacterium]|nr:SDR family oxidoreductase [Deltaproteobacteria bacterium]